MNRKIMVQGSMIRVLEIKEENYISLTDMAASFEGDSGLIEKWLRNKNTIEFLGIWEKLHNQDFNSTEFEEIKSEAGTNRFMLSVKKWIERTKGRGLSAKTGRYESGTFAHEDIAIEFGAWLSPEFKLYLIKEFKKFKKFEAQRASKDWQLNRALSKINYRIHTDAINKHMIPPHISNKDKWRWFTPEADILNLALFGKTAKQWHEENPEKEGNIRDHATQEQLLVLANLESMNSQLVKEKMPKQKRLQKLNEMAIDQMTALLKSTTIKRLQ